MTREQQMKWAVSLLTRAQTMGLHGSVEIFFNKGKLQNSVTKVHDTPVDEPEDLR